MSFKYKIVDGGGEMEVYDHEGSLVATITNDGSGFRIPDRVISVMRDEAEKARSNNNTKRWRDIHIRLATSDIKQIDAE